METKSNEDIKATLLEKAKLLNIKLPRVSLAGFKFRDKAEKLSKEEVRQEKEQIKWLKSVIASAEARAKMKPIEKRRALLRARFRAVKNRKRPNTYSDKNIKAWLEELDLIERNPKSWNTITKNGTLNYTPSNKKKKSARDTLDGMDLED